jgi:hypothetical protein
VILSGCADDALQAVAGRLLQMMASVTIKWWGEELSVAVSIGQTGAVAGDTLESILQRAQHTLKEDPVAMPVHAAAASGTQSSRS